MRFSLKKRNCLESDCFVKDKFIYQNRKVWGKKNIDDGSKYCYIAHWTPNYLASLLPQLIFARGLAEQESVKILVLSHKVDDSWVQFNESFGATQEIMQKKLSDKIKGVLTALFLILKKTSGEEVIAMHYKGIPIGKCIYDHIVRFTEDQFTIQRLAWKNRYKLYDVFSTLSCVYRIFRKKKPSYYIPFERCHIEGVLTIMAAYMGAEVIQCTANGRVIYLGSGDKMLIRYHDHASVMLSELMEKDFPEDYADIVKNELYSKFAGKGDEDHAFSNKKVISRQKFVEINGLDGKKKNAVIMSHVFSDEPHSSEFMLFKDYYKWYESVLERASRIKSVNWIVKAHPWRAAYGESDEAYNTFLRYKTDNMVWCADEYSSESLIDVADVILTVCGTCGTEFSCFGIPIVLAAKAYYSGYGFTIEPQTVEEYYAILEKLHQIAKLSEEQVDWAHKVFYSCLLMRDRPYDKLDEMLVKSYTLDVKNANTLVLRELSNNLKKNQNFFLDTKFYYIGTSIRNEIVTMRPGHKIYI